jgi:hypothetical protein
MVSTRLYPGADGGGGRRQGGGQHERLSNRGQTRYDWQHYIPLVQSASPARCATARRSRTCRRRCSAAPGAAAVPGGDRVMAQVLAIVPKRGWMRCWWRWSWPWRAGPPSGRVSVEHVINVLARLNARRCRRRRPPRCKVSQAPLADTARYDSLRGEAAARCRRPIMRDVMVELKQLRLHGMAGAWGIWSSKAAVAGWTARAGCSSTCCRPRAPTGPCARSATRCTRPSSRCTATWRASTSRSRRWTAS